MESTQGQILLVFRHESIISMQLEVCYIQRNVFSSVLSCNGKICHVEFLAGNCLHTNNMDTDEMIKQLKLCKSASMESEFSGSIARNTGILNCSVSGKN